MNDLPELDRVIATQADREKLLALIAEQAALVRKATDWEHDWKERARQYVHIAIQLTMTVIGAVYWLAMTESDGSGWRLALSFPPEFAPPGVPGLDVFMGTMLLSLLVVTVIDIWELRIDRNPTTKRLELRPLFGSLERLVSRAAFLEDHANLSTDERLRFQARIGEAESALEAADRALRRRTTILRLPWRRQEPWTTRHYRTRTRSL